MTDNHKVELGLSELGLPEEIRERLNVMIGDPEHDADLREIFDFIVSAATDGRNRVESLTRNGKTLDMRVVEAKDYTGG